MSVLLVSQSVHHFVERAIPAARDDLRMTFVDLAPGDPRLDEDLLPVLQELRPHLDRQLVELAGGAWQAYPLSLTSLGLPHVLVDTAHGKLEGFHDSWTRGSRTTYAAGSAAEATRIAERLLAGRDADQDG